MAAKQGLKEKVNVAWYRRCLRDPEFAEKYGSNGWRVFTDFMEDEDRPTQQKMSDIFDVTLTTMNRWHKQYKLPNGVV